MEIDVETPFGNITPMERLLSDAQVVHLRPLRLLLLYTTAVRDTAKF